MGGKRLILIVSVNPEMCRSHHAVLTVLKEPDALFKVVRQSDEHRHACRQRSLREEVLLKFLYFIM